MSKNSQSQKRSDWYAVIMAGGTGTRLWPLSRKENPKQFQKLTSAKTMIQETYDRVSKVVPAKNIRVSTTAEYRNLVLRQLPQIKTEQLIIEPLPRGTAPAISLVAQSIHESNSRAIIATAPSDHAIKNTNEFSISLSVALETAQRHPDKLVTVGVNPTVPDTGLGYIKMGKEFSNAHKKRIFYVDKFTEKPDRKTAEKYLAGWEYLWNAGYFIFSAGKFLEWAKKFTPDILVALKKAKKEAKKAKIKAIYGRIKPRPVEPAIVEKLDSRNLLVVPSELEWSDVGNWGTLFDFFKSGLKASLIAKGKHIDAGSRDCLVYSSDKLIATVGLKDVIIVETADAILVADRKNAGEVRKIIEKLKEKGKHSYL
jgi:mannose-1-phosphate guanylyltransferase